MSKPYDLDPFLLLFLTAVSMQRILLLDVLLVGFFCLAVITYFQLTYILTFIKSSINKEFNDQVKSEHESIYNFNNVIKSHFILKILFIIFIIFLTWDVILVIYNAFVVPLDTKLFPESMKFIVVTYLIDAINSLQQPFNYFGIVLLIILFVATLVVLNIVSIKLNEIIYESSFLGTLTYFLISLVLIISYLIYDLQNYTLEPLQHFQTIIVSTYIFYNHGILLVIAIYCDLFLAIFFIAFISRQTKAKFQKESLSVIPPEDVEEEQPINVEGEIIEENIEEENIIRDVDY